MKQTIPMRNLIRNYTTFGKIWIKMSASLSVNKNIQFEKEDVTPNLIFFLFSCFIQFWIGIDFTATLETVKGDLLLTEKGLYFYATKPNTTPKKVIIIFCIYPIEGFANIYLRSYIFFSLFVTFYFRLSKPNLNGWMWFTWKNKAFWLFKESIQSHWRARTMFWYKLKLILTYLTINLLFSCIRYSTISLTLRTLPLLTTQWKSFGPRRRRASQFPQRTLPQPQAPPHFRRRQNQLKQW